MKLHFRYGGSGASPTVSAALLILLKKPLDVSCIGCVFEVFVDEYSSATAEHLMHVRFRARPWTRAARLRQNRRVIRIALIGDYNEAVIAHRAIPLALTAAAQSIGVEVHADWLHTSTIGDAKQLLATCDGIWCVPGSPYVNANGALAAIRYARQSGRPFLGTCGGFQHALLEYAHDVWDMDAPAHAETDPNASDPVIAPLTCSLLNIADALHFVPGSRLVQIYGTTSATEEYQCSYGLSPRYEARLKEGPLRVAARDSEGSVRGVELVGHPFFIATLFQPERAALQGRIPPIASAFVMAAASVRN